ncbi:response regulator [Propionivibrio sp.]|uniref:response regulator n=1 Tax=Propionivibrio sp. TaxID=2212460 RepID=UPI003BF271D5
MITPHVFRILLVEDEPGDARLMQMAIRKSGYPLDLQRVEDGLTALECLSQQGERFRSSLRPDLILLDLKMPGKGGIETLQAIKQSVNLRAIPVVVITTSALEADVSAAYRHGAAGFVPKPTDLIEFVAVVKTLLDYWLMLVRLPNKYR